MIAPIRHHLENAAQAFGRRGIDYRKLAALAERDGLIVEATLDVAGLSASPQWSVRWTKSTMPNWQTQRGDRRPVDAVDRGVFDERRVVERRCTVRTRSRFSRRRSA